MEFLRVVEEELRGLAAEARRRHPVVQEAAERCVYHTSPPLPERVDGVVFCGAAAAAVATATTMATMATPAVLYDTYHTRCHVRVLRTSIS